MGESQDQLLENITGAIEAVRNGGLTQAELLLSLAVREAERFGNYDPRLAPCLCNLAIVLDKQGKHDESEPLFERALKIWKVNESAYPLALAVCLEELAGHNFSRSDYSQAEKRIREALALKQEVLIPGHAEVSKSMNRLGVILIAMERLQEADTVLNLAMRTSDKKSGQRANAEYLLQQLALIDSKEKCNHSLPELYLSTSLLGENDPDPVLMQIASNLHGLAKAYAAKPKFPEAAAILSSALKLVERGVDPNKEALILTDRSNFCRMQQQLSQAESQAKAALKIWSRLSKGHPEYARALGALAHTHQFADRWKEAITLLQQQFEMLDSLPSSDCIEKAQAEVVWALGCVHDELGQHDDANKWFTRYVRLSTREDVDSSASSLEAIAMLKLRLRALGKSPKDNTRITKTKERLGLRSLWLREHAFGADHPNVIKAIDALIAFNVMQDKLTECEKLHKRALEIAIKANGDGHPDVADRSDQLATCLQLQAKVAEAEPHLKRSLEIRRSTLAAEHPQLQKSLLNLAFFYARLGMQEKATELLAEVGLPKLKDEKKLDHPKTTGENQILEKIYQLALWHIEQRKPEDAEVLVNLALDWIRQAHGEEILDSAKFYRCIGDAYRMQGRYDRAEEMYQSGLSTIESLLSSEDPAIIEHIDALTWLYDTFYSEKATECTALHDRALHIREKSFGKDHPEYAKGICRFAGHFSYSNDAEAEQLYKYAVEILEACDPRDNADLADTLSCLAHLYERQKKFDDAETYHKRAVDLTEEQTASRFTVCLYGFGRFLQEHGRNTEAEAHFKRAIDIWNQEAAPHTQTHPTHELCLEHYAELLRAENRIEEALSIEEQVQSMKARRS